MFDIVDANNDESTYGYFRGCSPTAPTCVRRIKMIHIKRSTLYLGNELDDETFPNRLRSTKCRQNVSSSAVQAACISFK